MAPTSRADRKAAADTASCFFNVVTSVGIIMVNRALMATYGFSFATTLTGLHFATTTLITVALRWLGYIQPSHLPLPELMKFVLFANLSIVGMNFFILPSCIIAFGTNLSQCICIGRFTPVSFQVLDHMKTILVLLLGFFLFGRAGMNLLVVVGMVLAVVWMICGEAIHYSLTDPRSTDCRQNHINGVA